MTVLCFDISSGGISAALFSRELEVIKLVEDRWRLSTDDAGAAALSIETIVGRFKQAVRGLGIADPVDAIAMASFMHNCVLLDAADTPLTPVFTWLDRRGENGMEYVRSRMGDKFHQRTGCRFHPMFPVFKLATLHLRDSSLMERARRVVSVRSFLTHRLTGVWFEDHGMASASGLYNIDSGDWDPALLGLLGLKRENLPPVVSRDNVIGRVTRDAASEFALNEGTPVINGSGDGFLANVGSDCETPDKISVTLGTSAVARQTLNRPVLDPFGGTFCYKADDGAFLFGCAGSNGGNALDWGRSIFGDLETEAAAADIPTFIPLLHGERSPEWNPHLTGSWYGLRSRHKAAELGRSVVEGVVFNLALYVEILQRASGENASEIVLSGNGFLNRLAPRILAAVAGVPARMPVEPGLASLRGAGVCALRALGSAAPPFRAGVVSPLEDPGISERYARYKKLRLSAGSEYLQSL